jgi:mono/diheme cytochrome c family protein
MDTHQKFLNRVVSRALFVAAGIILLLMPVFAEFQEGQTEVPQTGVEIYLYACANCHGMDGKGRSQSRLGFSVPLPDFTDCDFTVREPDSDWVAVTVQGGPSRGFSELMPAFGKVLTVEQIEKAVRHIRTFCTDHNWPAGELNLPLPLFTEKAYPEDEAIVTASVSEDIDQISGEFIYEQRFGPRNQVEIKVPFGWSQMTVLGEPDQKTDWASSLGDVAVGVKRAIFHNWKRGSIFSAAAEIVLPTGDEARGFGKGTFVFEPFISFGQILSAEFFIHSQAGLEIPAKTENAENEAFFRLVLGRTFTSGSWGRAWSPMIELLASRELVSGEKINWDVVPEIQVTLNKRQHIMFNIGVRIPVNNTSGRNVSIAAYLLWDWFDGGFFEGW